MAVIADEHNADLVTVDGTSIRVHRSAATLKNDPRRCVGRSRSGLTAKIHARVNETGLPIPFELKPGQGHDAPVCRILLDQLQSGQAVLADKAYDADWIRKMIWEQGAIDVIPSKSNRKAPKEFNAELYKSRNFIERFFGRLKASFRSITTRLCCTNRLKGFIL